MKITTNDSSLNSATCPKIEIHQKASLSSIQADGYQMFLNATKLKEIIAPVRMRGLTSSGALGQCFWNVANLVELFGGKVLLGWAIINNAASVEMINNQLCLVSKINFVGHALWLNDKGKISDPTAKSWLNVIDLNSTSTDYNLINENDNLFIKFIPLKTTNEDLPYLPYSLDLEKVEDLSGNIIKDWSVHIYDSDQDKRTHKISWTKIKLRSNDKNFLVKTGSSFSKDRNSFIRRHRYSRGRFTEKSIASGMTIDEIRERRLTINNNNKPC